MANLEDEKMSPAQIGIGTVVVLVTVVIFCFVVWQVTHKEDKANIIVTQNTESEQDEVSGLPVVSEAGGETNVVTELQGTDTDTIENPVETVNTDNDLDMTFTTVKELVTAKDVTNLRSEPSTSQGKTTVVGQLKNGDYVERVGIDYASGWSKLNYNGKTVYAVSQYLTTKEDENVGREDD